VRLARRAQIRGLAMPEKCRAHALTLHGGVCAECAFLGAK